jgi:hypothetical protein
VTCRRLDGVRSDVDKSTRHGLPPTLDAPFETILNGEVKDVALSPDLDDALDLLAGLLGAAFVG